MKIGIVTYVKCDNYGAELQAYALQWKLNKLGYDAEVIDLQKIEKDLASNASSIVPAIVNRFKILGWKAPWSILKLAINVLKRKVTAQKNENNIKLKHRLFIDFCLTSGQVFHYFCSLQLSYRQTLDVWQ